MECRNTFHQSKLMERLLPDIAEVLNVSYGDGESADELEGRIVTLATGAKDGDIPWQSECASERRTLEESPEGNERERLGPPSMAR